MTRSGSEPSTLLSVTLDTPHHKRQDKRFKNATNVKITTVIRYLILLLIKGTRKQLRCLAYPRMNPDIIYFLLKNLSVIHGKASKSAYIEWKG